jgi:hypothetical protein
MVMVVMPASMMFPPTIVDWDVVTVFPVAAAPIVANAMGDVEPLAFAPTAGSVAMIAPAELAAAPASPVAVSVAPVLVDVAADAIAAIAVAPVFTAPVATAPVAASCTSFAGDSIALARTATPVSLAANSIAAATAAVTTIGAIAGGSTPRKRLTPLRRERAAGWRVAVISLAFTADSSTVAALGGAAIAHVEKLTNLVVGHASGRESVVAKPARPPANVRRQLARVVHTAAPLRKSRRAILFKIASTQVATTFAAAATQLVGQIGCVAIAGAASAGPALGAAAGLGVAQDFGPSGPAYRRVGTPVPRGSTGALGIAQQVAL